MNQFILKIKIINNKECTLEIDFIQWNRKFISLNMLGCPRIFCYYENKNNFTIYSQNNGGIWQSTHGDKIHNSLEIPEYKYVVDKEGKFKGFKICHDFENEYERYNYLKGLYLCLNDLKKEHSAFKEDKNIDGIILNGEFWIG